MAFFDTTLKWNSGKISIPVCIGSVRILTNTYTITPTTKQAVNKVLFPSCLIECITLKDNLTWENGRIKQVSMDNGYHENIIGKTYWQSQVITMTTTNASHRCPRGLDQHKYKFTIHFTVLVKNYCLYSDLTKWDHFLLRKYFA